MRGEVDDIINNPFRVISQTMSLKTGVSWNKRFKKQFGSINKVSYMLCNIQPSSVPRLFLGEERAWAQSYIQQFGSINKMSYVTAETSDQDSVGC